MKSAIRLTRVSHLCGKVVNAAVIVDPLHNQIIATACDGTCLAPSSAIDRSSKSASFIEHTARIGSLNSVVNQQPLNEDLVLKLSADDCSQSDTEASCLYPWEWITKRPYNSGSVTNSRENNSWHPLRHAALVAIENAAARDKLLFPASDSLKDQAIQNDNSQHSFVEIPAKRQKTEISEDNISEEASANGLPLVATRPYLCTGFDIYLVWEPCTMCAMALVHQRIRRVFYAFPNRNCGALGSVYRLQGERSLNHHYSVYRILLPEKILHDREETDSVHCRIPD